MGRSLLTFADTPTCPTKRSRMTLQTLSGEWRSRIAHTPTRRAMDEVTTVSPDLQASLICEDVRQEVNGMQTLVGIINMIPARVLPVAILKLCVWTRWCGGIGRFRQVSRILGADEEQILAESRIEFELKDMESHVTNVNLFTGVQFQRYGLHYVEILLENELRLRYPVPVVKL